MTIMETIFRAILAMSFCLLMYYINVNDVLAEPYHASQNSNDPNQKMSFKVVEEKGFGDLSYYDIRISAEGRIVSSTSQDLAEFLINNGLFGVVGFRERNLKPYTKVVIEFKSAGGDLDAGMHMGQLIRQLNYDTYVDGYCNSACTYAFIGGVYRYYPERSVMFVHRFQPLSQDNRDAIMQSKGGKLGRYVEEMGVQSNFLDLASSTDQGLLLSIKDANILGVSNQGIGNPWSKTMIRNKRASISFGRSSRDGNVIVDLMCDYPKEPFTITISQSLIAHKAASLVIANALSEGGKSEYYHDWMNNFDQAIYNNDNYKGNVFIYNFGLESAIPLMKRDPRYQSDRKDFESELLKPSAIKTLQSSESTKKDEKRIKFYFTQDELYQIDFSLNLTILLYNRKTKTYMIMSEIPTSIVFQEVSEFTSQCVG